MNAKQYFIFLFIGGFVFSAFLSCGKDEPTPLVEADEHLSGGLNGSTTVLGDEAFGTELKNLTTDEQNAFVVGNSLFRSNWVIAPSSVQSLDGVGPILNAISCGSCHFKDGRAKPPATPTEALNGLLFRLSIDGFDAHGAPLPDPNYGGQLQDKAIMGVEPEAQVNVSYEVVTGTYADGTTYNLRRPIYKFYNLKYGALAPSVKYSPRIAPQLMGLGLLENVTESDILSLSDENDANKDGISGKPNRVWDATQQKSVLGRFGWKANEPTVRQQTAGAFNGDMGITSSIFPKDHLTASQQQLYANVPNGGTPELSDEQLRKITVYMQSLSVPVRRNVDAPSVIQGKNLFKQLNCQGCHRAEITTSNQSPIAALNNQKIRPYTDLLLHDMGNDLADNRPDFLATGLEWRTPPLWGIGLIKSVNKHTFLLHDGRARNLEEAILWHSGEGEKSKNEFKKLNKTEREALIAFLENL
ncbi:MAG: di-heme oxidoredictase family protein [Saprospiraceae bacterium]|nr:di-heme oxidoredictase family protein [Saprospiraceae bacterium]